MDSETDIRTWLEKLGLGHYTQLFEQQEIDLSILPDLSDGDLVELGLPLGPRRKIQKTISSTGTPVLGRIASPTSDVEDSPIPGELPDENAERRQLTIMFADIVGSSAMSTKIDPEELRDLMRAFQDACKAAVDRYQGFIARFMGDGVLAYFGFPQAHEDDPERSVRAGMALTEMVADLNEKLCAGKDVELAVRIGIATGPVVVGDLIGEGASAERSVVGETPNIAAKIEASAPPGNVVVGENTRNLLGNLFETEELPPLALDGFGESISLFRIVTERVGVSRYEATQAGTRSGFVGRKDELNQLRECWRSTCSSKGLGILITGEAGIGKSRITEEFLRHISPTNPIIWQFQCSTFHTNSAFHPITERFMAVAGVSRDSGIEETRTRLDAFIREAPRPRSESLQLLASLLSVDIGESLPPRLADNPPLRLVAIHEMVVEQLLARSDEGPIVVVFEDAHWMDPTTLETALQLSRASRQRRMLVLVTSRPDVGTEHFLRREMQTINLRGLNRAETTELVRNLPQGRDLTKSTLRAVLDRTDGIPLFVEELTKLVKERDDDAELNIPSTLIDSLTARLDRLDSAKSVAQIGATIGREFSLDLLCRIDTRDRQLIVQDISRLMKAELVQEIGSKEAPRYRFKHALVQDAAYGTLLYSKRREHHSKIADTLLEVFSESAEESPEIIAHHLDECNRTTESVNYWRAAGLKAISRSANTEAVHHLGKGIEALNKSSSTTQDLLKRELDLQIALGPALVAARGYASDELEAAYSRALEIGELLEEGINDFRALWGLGSFYLLRGRLEQGKDLLLKCLALAEEHENTDWLILATSWVGTAEFYLDRKENAHHHLERSIEIYESAPTDNLAYLFGLDPAVLARVHLVWLSWLEGKPDVACQLDEDTVSFAKSLNHPLSYVHALNFSVVLQAFLGRYEKAVETADLVLSVSGEFEFPHYLAYSRITRGYAKSKLGLINEGIDDMVSGLKARRETGAELVRPMFLTMLAEVLAESGQLEWSLQVLEEADAIIAKTYEAWLGAESLRVRGLVLERKDPGGEATIACLQQAVKHAEKASSVSLEIRALNSLIEVLNTRASKHETLKSSLQRLDSLITALPDCQNSLDRQQSIKLLSER